jgi:predicted acylesterase/phospholipase RssA
MDRLSNQPRIGLALSGAAARSVYYIGFLEVLTEHGIKIDYIAASSGAAIVAASYACGTLQEFKEFAFSLNSGVVMSTLERSKRGGLYNLDPTEEIFRRFTKGLKFEEVKPLMGFLAADIETGEQVILSMGDLAHAARISCTVPGLFEPIQWGNRILVDGGLLSIVPGDVVRKAGVDVVIGVHVRASKHIFKQNQLIAKQIFNGFKKILLLDQAENLWKQITERLEGIGFFDYYTSLTEDKSEHEFPGMLNVLGKSLDLAIEADKKSRGDLEDPNYQCDLLITSQTGSKTFGSINFKEIQSVYETGRIEATESMPKIMSLIQKHQVNVLKV